MRARRTPPKRDERGRKEMGEEGEAGKGVGVRSVHVALYGDVSKRRQM